MKKLCLLLLLAVVAKAALSQSISPATTSEQCPLTNITFTVTLPKIKSGTTPTVISYTNSPDVIGGISNLATNNMTNLTTFNFTGKFRDVNIVQTFRVTYTAEGNSTSSTQDFPFKNIKSLFYAASQTCTPIQPNPSVITAPICQVVNVAVSFSKISWSTYGESPANCFGTIDDYEYQLPQGWSIGSSPSTGSNWIPGSNSVTITSNTTSGSGGGILIRPRNICGTNLANNYTPAYIAISRSAATFSVSPSSLTLNCGTTTAQTFTVSNVNNVPNVTGYTWNLGNTPNGWSYNGSPAPSSVGLASNVTSITLTPTGTQPPASISVTANVSSCGNFTTSVPVQTVFSSSIIGADNPCAGSVETYSLSGSVPVTATVTWSISPTDGVSLSPNGSSVDLTLTDPTRDVNYVLTATVSGACNATKTKSFSIPSNNFIANIYGDYGYSTFWVAANPGDNYIYQYGITYYDLQVTANNVDGGYPNAYWEYLSGAPITGSGWHWLHFNFDTYTDGYYNFHFTDACGSHTVPFNFIATSTPPQFRAGNTSVKDETFKLSISPNPASSIVKMTITSNVTNKSVPSKKLVSNRVGTIKIIDKMGVSVLQAKVTISGNSFTLDVSRLKKGNIYNVSLADGESILYGKLLTQ